MTARIRSSARRAVRRADETAQAAIAMVLGLTLLLVTGGGILAANAMQHDPLVQADAVQHYAYRALQAGINSYLSTINAQPDLVDCSATSTAPTCTNTDNGIEYDLWTQVPKTTRATGTTPEYYLWTNPQLCFSQKVTTDTACAAKATTGKGNFEYLQVEIIGAAGYPGSFLYQSSVVNFSAGQGFLTRIWWSNYEATDLKVSDPTQKCHYDWKTTKYSGTDGTCTPVYFGPGDVVDGPVFTNDSIYVTSKPTFGTPTHSTVNSPVDTADPHCLFVAPNDGRGTKNQCAKAASTNVTRYTKTNSHDDLPVEPIPTSDSQLETLAKEDGCVYTGPTTISFYAKTKRQYMNVFSPETSVKTGKDATSSSDRDCIGSTGKAGEEWTGIPAPTTANTGNGVVYVADSTSTTCNGNGDNPFDGTIQRKMTSKAKTAGSAASAGTIKAQLEAADHLTGTTHGYDYVNGDSPGTDDCSGDVFVRDSDSVNTPSGATGGIAGNLTVAAQNNVIITGDLEYTDCGNSFERTHGYERTCTYNPSGVNDSLGLIATDFVEVNRPGNPACTSSQSGGNGGKRRGRNAASGGGNNGNGGNNGSGGSSSTTVNCSTTPTSILPTCSSSVSDLTAVLCNPGPTVVVDAAVLALKGSFVANDDAVGGTTKRLYIYGSVDQDYRGPIGTFSGSSLLTGYSKYYVWDSRLQYVTIPHYLTPATPSWVLSSSSVQMSTSCPSWPKAYPTGSPLTPHRTTPAHVIPSATTTGPTGASGAC